MGKVNKANNQTGAKGPSEPLAPVDILQTEYGAKPNNYQGLNIKDTAKQTEQGFNPDDFEYVTNPSALDHGLESINAVKQPTGDILKRSLKQFGANLVGAIATSALHSADIGSTFDILAGKETDFNSSLFGVSTRDIMDWSQDVAKDNRIYENVAGNFDPSDIAWWGNQFASAGTGVGMGIYALGETAAVSAATEGLGSVPEIFNQLKKFPQLMRMMKSAKTAEQAIEISNLAKNLKRTATTYAVMNRLNESKMEAQQTYEEAYEELKSMKNNDGSPKYTDEEAKSAAASGARRDFMWNLPLMAMDVLTYRTMVFNPLSGAGTGVVEKGLSKVAGSLAKKGFMGRAAGWALPHAVGMTSEGLEEGLQYIGANEGKHYARVMAGLDDGSTFMQRLGQDVTNDEFWNNFAGGVIGSPIIGGTMKLFNKAMNGRSQRRLSDLHNDYIKNVGQMDSAIGQLIREHETEGNTELAKVLRRNFGANKALSALYLDSMKGSGAAFDSYKNFLQQTLDEAKQGKVDNLKDLGFANPTGTQIEQITQEYQTYLNDASRMERIFNQVGNQHERQFIAPIAQQMFSLETRREKQAELQTLIDSLKGDVFGYSALTNQGKEIFDTNYKLLALFEERKRLNAEREKVLNPMEKESIDAALDIVERDMASAEARVKEINADEAYTKDLRDSDASIISAPVRDQKYFYAIRDSVANASQINIESRDLALWNSKEYKDEQSLLSIINSRTEEQLEDMERDLESRNNLSDNLKAAIKNKKTKLAAQEAIKQKKAKDDDVANPVVTSPIVEQAEQTGAADVASVTSPEVTAKVEESEAGGVITSNAIPQGNSENASAVSSTVDSEIQIGNSDLFGEAMNNIVNIATEQSEAVSAKDSQVINGFDLSKVEITNIDELIEDGSGRVNVSYDGNPISYTSFDITISDEKVPDATLMFDIKLKKDGQIDLVVPMIKLGQALSEKGIKFSNYTNQTADIKLWNQLIDMGYARSNSKTFTDITFVPNPIPDADQYSGKIEISLAPVEISDDLTQEQRDRLSGAVQVLLQGMANPTFEDLVRSAIKQSNVTIADNTFNLLTKGWELAGYAPADYRSVYVKVFQDPIGTLNSLLGELGKPNEVSEPQDVKATEVATEAAVEDTINTQQKPTDFTNSGTPIYDYTGVVTEEAQKKFAFLTVPYVETITVRGDTITVDKQNIPGELNQGDYVDSLKLLDYNAYGEGTEMQVMVPTNFMDIKVSVTNTDGTPGTAITFGQYVAERNLTPDMQEYKDKLPMIIYDKGKTNQRGVAFVHDVQWYNPLNFLQSRPGEMEAVIKSTREMRQEVIDANGKPVGITITSKRETTFDGLKLPSGQHISLKEANPQATIAVAKNIEQVTTDGKNIAFEGELANVRPLMENMAYDIRQTGKREGKPIYTAFPLTQPALSDASKTSINLALKVFVNAHNPYLSAGDKAIFDSAYNQILATSNIDIRSVNGISQYLQQFMHVFMGNNVSGVADAEAQLKALGKKEGYKYLTINSAGGITFGTLGVPMAPKNNGFFVNRNPGANPETSFRMANNFLANIAKTDFLGSYQQHVHFGSLNKNKPVVHFDAQGTPTVHNSYKDYLMGTLLTNVRSINLGTGTNPNYVTSVQPIITYETNSKINKSAKPETQEAVKEEVVPENTIIDQRAEVNLEATEGMPEEKQANLEALRRDQEALIQQARQELGLDFLREDDVDFDNFNFSPVELTEEQREAFAESVQRIAGLNPQQQSELIDFMYNQVIAMIEVGDKEGLSKDEVFKSVKKTFEAIIKPLRKTYIDKVKMLKSMIETDADSPYIKDMKLAVASYNRSIERINDIQANYKMMEDATMAKVDIYTNISKVKVKQDLEQDSDDVTNEDEELSELGDGASDRAKEFGVDTLTENPDSKLTYAMRRFLGSIRQVDKQGNPAVGFLRLPLYVGSDTVATTVRDLLADVPSDYDTMIAKLEQSIPAHGWLRELIDRMNASTQERKNQFVTVMSNHRLSMRFAMISYDRKTGLYSSKVYDTFQSGLAQQLMVSWYNNFIDSSLVTMINEVYTLDTKVAQQLVDEYQSWIGGDVRELKSPIESVANMVRTITRKNPTIYIDPKGELEEELKAMKEFERKQFSLKGIKYQITKDPNGYKVGFFSRQQAVQAENAKEWLSKMGIQMSEAGFSDLMTRGLYHNYERVSGDALFTSPNGLFRILSQALSIGINSSNKDLVTGDGNPLNESVVKSLANLESNFNTSVNSPNGRDGGKSIFGFTAPKFITDRTRDLKVKDGKTVQELSSISFSKKALWLDLLTNSDKFRDQFQVSHIGLTALKEMGKKVYKDNSITKLSDIDHELTKLIMFWDTKQGTVSYNNGTVQYGDTGIDMRMATMFVPTMSDKSNMMLLKTAVLNLEDKHFAIRGSGTPKPNANVLKAIYEQTVRPEILRMVRHAQLGGKTNISSYDAGAKMFLLMPTMNNIMYDDKLTLADAITNGVEEFNLEFIESRKDIMDKIYHELEEVMESLTDKKIAAWEKSGFIQRNPEGVITAVKFIDKDYIKKFSGTPEEKAHKAAIDFETNSVVSNANSFMLYAGDPAIYFKSKADDPIQKAKDTFTNIGKRLANQIAPGTTIANSENELYIQIFLDDRKSIAEIPFLKFATRVNDGKEITDKEIEQYLTGDKNQKRAILNKFPRSAGYFEIEGADAQEYTTWREHLSLLERLGKTPDGIFNITPEEIREARELFASFEGGKRAKLTAVQEKLIGKVLQPMKPVYTGQIYDSVQDVMRTVYVKSSSFPLIPQLTAGLEIDQLRESMEAIEKKTGKGVRASYQTANKVGSINTPVKIWNADGTLDKASLKQLEIMPDQEGSSMLTLTRKNFRIQQDVPFKSGKKNEDKITLGTQLMKILFGNGVIDASNFTFEGVSHTGRSLHKIYNDAFESLIKIKKEQLYDELGLDSRGLPVDEKKSINKLQQILKDEAINRGYPIQDIEGLELDADGNFITPLWSSANSNRYESMLNSIVTNRLVKIKFPGNSYVVGSEEGFKFQEGLQGVNTSKVVWTNKWDGKGLQGSFKKNGQIEKAQVLAASKFRDREGKLIDLFTKKDGEYVYITETEQGFRLKEDMIDADLLSLTSFRIPTSGHVSAAQVEVVGFLPAENADLMIVPRNFTKQMGLDFDVDKQNTYQLWHYQNAEGKFEVLNEAIVTDILNNAKGVINDKTAYGNLITAIFGDAPDFTVQEIMDDKELRYLNNKLQEKLLQNKIVNVHKSVLTNPSDAVQSKINGILSTDYAEEQADIIDELINGKTDTDATAENGRENVFVPLSSEYQKMKMGLGASGKVGTGAYSLDVVFHSLVQQAKSLGNPLQLTEETMDEEGKVDIVNKTFRFGNQVSKGELGNEMTIKGDRSISEVLAERQNIALDNEKLQVMGRVNLNDITIDVDKVFNLLGFDKGEDGNSISLLFLSQPVIRDYVEMMKNLSSNMAEFSADKQSTVIGNLLRKYLPEDKEMSKWGLMRSDEEYNEKMSRRMTTKEMVAGLGLNPDGELQIAILDRFLEMQSYGVAIKNIQVGINTDAKGLGKSFFDVIAKREAINKLGNTNPLIQGAKNLIGDYVPYKSLTPDEYENHIQQGYVNIGNYLVRPTSLSGSFNIHAITTAYNLWSKHMPYDTSVANRAYEEIMAVISSSGDNSALVDNKAVILKQDIFKALKKYFSANSSNGIVNTGDDVNSERERLYIDSETNTSLAKYIKNLRETENSRIINNYIKTNKLINRFELSIQKDGTPSLIKFNNAVGEDFDEQYLYDSLSNLLAANEPLPDYNGKAYTTTLLAQDLISYSYLGNATQEAIQFTKYIPVLYNNTVGYSQFMKESGNRLAGDIAVIGGRMSNPNEFSFDSNFAIQFVQHNPERVKFKLQANDMKNQILNVNNGDGRPSMPVAQIESFSLKLSEGQNPPKYVSVYDRGMAKGEKKFRLYMNQGDGVFKRIPVLGTFGMDEYNPKLQVNQSSVNGKIKVDVRPSNVKFFNRPDAQNDIFGINSGNGKIALDNIARANLPYLSDLARELAPYSSNIVVAFKDMLPKGMYNEKTNAVFVNSDLASDKNLLAKNLLHEVVHALTVTQISQYITQDGENVTVSTNAPAYVSRLVRLFNAARAAIGEEKMTEIRAKLTGQQKLQQELDNSTTDEERAAIRSRLNQYKMTPEEARVYYGVFNIKEFMTLALTESMFQKELGKHTFGDTGITMWERFKDILNSILQAIGVNFSQDSITAQAINATFELISGENVKPENNTSGQFDEMAMMGFGTFEDSLSEADRAMLEDTSFDGDPEVSLNLAEYPSVPNINENNCY